MGTLELQSKKRSQRHQLRGIILGTVQVAGLIGIAVVAPNVIQHMHRYGLLISPQQSDVIKRSSKKLVKDGHMSWEQGKLRLTAKGELLLMQLKLRAAVMRKPRRWDKKWRVLTFDISERRRATRDALRRTLYSIGFRQLQQSVWIYPYDCEDFVVLLKADFKIGKDVLYMIVDTLENDQTLKQHFGL